MDHVQLSRSTTPIDFPNHQSTAQSLTQDESPTTSEDSNGRYSDEISSQVSDSTRGSTFHSLSPTESPPIQVMERPEDFELEHEKIQSSIFSSSRSSSLEWSSVSNESLFSIHMTNSYTHDQAHLSAAKIFKSDELMNSGDLTRPCSPMGGDSDVDCLNLETQSKSDVPMSDLDEPQKVVRWKTQVERPADEGMPPQGHQWESSPLNDHQSSEIGNQSAPRPKKKFGWSWCDCGSCNPSTWFCWKGCWTSMSCSNCKPKKVCSPHAAETKTPTSASPKKQKLDVKLQKPPTLKKGCCFKSRFSCFSSWSCPCHCC